MPKQKQKYEHLPVLIKEVLDYLAPQPGQSYLDLTAGKGGHAATILDITKAPEKTVLVDRDETAAAALTEHFGGVQIIHMDFLGALRELKEQNRRFDMVLADLGVSSPHLDEPERGFSFNKPGPLDMRMDRRQAATADELVNQADEAELAKVLSRYGEEPKAQSIAQAIVRNRPIKDTTELAATISAAGGRLRRRSKIHPATKSFQALRIAVNDELGQLEQSLPLMAKVLNPGGRLAVISFHSLEDRVVKRYFSEHSGDRYDAEFRLLTKKPVTASRPEIVFNPRARSAKLRAAAKIKIQ